MKSSSPDKVLISEILMWCAENPEIQKIHEIQMVSMCLLCEKSRKSRKSDDDMVYKKSRNLHDDCGWWCEKMFHWLQETNKK
jgi:hypothetical protein